MKGLIGGALRGAGQTMQQIGTANMQANIEAEKAKAEESRQMRILELKQQYDTQNMERESELRIGNTVLDNQLRGEELERGRNFTAEQADKEMAAREKLTSMQIRASGRKSAADEEREQLLAMKNRYLNETDPEARKKLAEDIAFFEGRTGAKPEYMSVKNELGAEAVYIKTPNGLMPAPILGGSAAPSAQQEEQGPWSKFRGGSAQSTNPENPRATVKNSGLISGNLPSSSVPVDGTNSQQVKTAFNNQIRKAMSDIQMQIVQAPTDQEKIQLVAQYSELQAKLRK
jgi:hypothetical protein